MQIVCKKAVSSGLVCDVTVCSIMCRSLEKLREIEGIMYVERNQVLQCIPVTFPSNRVLAERQGKMVQPIVLSCDPLSIKCINGKTCDSCDMNTLTHKE